MGAKKEPAPSRIPFFSSKEPEPDLTVTEKAKIFMACHWRGVLIIIIPILFIPVLLPFPPTDAQWTAYTLLLMAGYWVTECIPLAITAFIPMAMFPVLGIMTTRQCCSNYMNDTVMMFIGSLVISYSVEQSGLHKRLAYCFIQMIGYSHLRLLLALCCVTTFVSMWITNTAATTMMVPINFAILKVFEDQGVIIVYGKTSDGDEFASDITSCYFCAVTYSATIGGIGTLVGTGTNLVFKGFFQSAFPPAPEYLSFPKFSAFAVPYVIICEALVYVYLAVVHFGWLRPRSKTAKDAIMPIAVQHAAAEVIAAEVKKKGALSYWEKMVVLLFGGAMILFFCRAPQMFDGWGDIITKYYNIEDMKYIRDACLAMFVAFLMSLFPRDTSFFKNFTCSFKEDLPKDRAKGVLDWKLLNSQCPYAFSFLLGGGFTLSNAASTSGLNTILGDFMKSALMDLNNALIMILIIVVVVFVTNFASNVAVCTVFTPIAMQLAQNIGQNPLWYNLASGIAASYCFMIPVGTPGNLIVQSAAKVPTSKMMYNGFGPTISTVILTWLAMMFWAPIIWPELRSDPVPDWSKKAEYEFSVSKMEFFEEWQKHPKENRNSRLYDFLSMKNDFSSITDASAREIKMTIARLSSKLTEKWESSGKHRDRFLTKESEWLAGYYTFKVSVHHSAPSTSRSASTPGRPSKEFDEASAKTKRRRVDDLLQSRDVNQLVVAAEISARLSGHRNLASVIKEASESPEKCQVMKRSAGVHEEPRCLIKEEALAYYVDAKSTSHSYKQTRKWSIKAGHRVFPSFYSVRQAKTECYPPEEHIFVNETRVEIKLQAVLNKTTERLITAQHEVLKSLTPGSSYSLISKWGCDGSSGHSTYKQKFTNSENTDEFLFVFSFVPLQLRDDRGNVVWQNPRPSSTMYCRPIKFIFSKETTDFTVTETNRILEEINQLVPTICNVDGNEVSVKHELLFTMIDGKVCNAMTETSSAQKCYICGATPKFMNDESREFVINKENLGFGISPLHAWIRTFECLLHISYRLEVKKWQLRDENDKTNVKQRSARIQEKFKAEMGLIVDKPKPGFGNTNDGNTARRFFENPELASEITGLDVNLIKKFGTILRTLAAGYDINVEKFNCLTQDTKKLYLSLYSWYYMPVTVHKILQHSVDIVKSALLPIGQLSEEAQEARNKDCRRFREHNTRKRSRVATNRDLLNMLLITSDPVINGLREVSKKPTSKLPSEVLELIIPPTVNIRSSVSLSSFTPNITTSDYDVEDSSEEEFSDVE